MVSEEEASSLWAKMNAAAGKTLTNNKNEKGEEAYALAYQKLVRAGLAMQLRRKYRVK